jgi:glycosyltransferase involved in cell wall biosynthesis
MKNGVGPTVAATRRSVPDQGSQMSPGQRLRVMHIITRLIVGGAQENTVLTVEDLRDDYGDEVLLVTGPAPGPEGDLFDRLQERGVPHVVVKELCRPVHPVYDWLGWKRLKELIRWWKPQVVHTHSSKAGVLGRAAAWSLGVPVIVHTVHGSPFHPYERRCWNWLYRRAEKWAAARCHGMIGVSYAVRDQFLHAGIGDPEFFPVIYSGMEVQEFLTLPPDRDLLRAQLGFQPHHVVIGTIARLFPLKGHDYLLQAAPILVRQDQRVRFLWVGDGILRRALEQQVRDLGLERHVVFAGLVPTRDVPRYLHAMDVVVHCSLREGLARVLAQAKLARKPVVAFRLDGAWEVIEDGVSGYLVEPGQTNQLVTRLLDLVQDAELRRAMGQAGVEPLVERFDHRHITRQIRDFYLRLLHAQPTRGAPWSPKAQ